MVERDRSDLLVVRRCQLLSISRSTFYATARGESDAHMLPMMAGHRMLPITNTTTRRLPR